MKTQSYPNTTKTASRLGFGAWPLGNKAHGKTMTESEGIALVKEALNNGITFFDTAPNYALGKSETILGKALKGHRSEVIINTKFGHHASGEINFDPASIRPSLMQSLTRLQTSYVDSLILHNPDHAILSGKTEHFDILRDLKSEGLIHENGVSVDTKEELDLVLKRDDIDVIELLFNIYAQATSTHLNDIKKRGIALIIKVPLDSGWLSGKYTKDSVFTDIRSRWTEANLKRRHELTNKLKAIVNDENLIPYALGFIWSFDAVTTVIPGIRNSKQLEEHVKSEAREFPLSLKEKLIDFYNEHIKDNPLPW
jgi:aryl-alcohol dehydrogenase-like predicted oxidoreductase